MSQSTSNVRSLAVTPTSSYRRTSVAVAIGVWMAGVAVGSLYSFHYATTPTETGAAVRHWPAATPCTLSKQRPTLLMFVHPRCPCTRASLEELALLMNRCRGRMDAELIFFKPHNSSDEWAITDLWERAGGISGVTRRIDAEGREQRRFGARVSGEVFLYLPNGELAFHGGITAGRGHRGDNRGRFAVEALLKNPDITSVPHVLLQTFRHFRDAQPVMSESLNHHDLPAETTSVFGCELEPHPYRPQKCVPAK